jgi:hypothetical protein
MANTKISALSSATTPLAGTEVLPIVQSGATVKVTSDDLTVRNIRANATTGILQITGPSAGATRVATVPNANWTAARTDAAQSFTGDQTLATGNLIIGTSGNGIDFSATPGTGTSELLADYEEGTWTPTLTGWTAITYLTRVGKYTKVGNQVTCWFEIYFTGINAASLVNITGLPFTVASSTNGGALSYYDAPVNTNGILLYPTSTQITLYADATSGAGVTSNGNATNKYFIGFVCFQA